MTYLEKYRERRPDSKLTSSQIIFGMCPVELSKCPENLTHKPIPQGCEACWNREIPEEAGA